MWTFLHFSTLGVFGGLLLDMYKQFLTWSKFDKKKGEDWKIDHEENIEKFLRIRLLDFLLFHINWHHKQL